MINGMHLRKCFYFTVQNAIGVNGVKALQIIWDEKKVNKPPSYTASAMAAMAAISHGTECEKHALATLIAIIIPALIRISYTGRKAFIV